MPTNASSNASEVEPGRARKPATREQPKPEGRSGPEHVSGSTRVNIAFPFSKINMNVPSQELGELAALVTDLITALEATTGGELKELRHRSEELSDRLN